MKAEAATSDLEFQFLIDIIRKMFLSIMDINNLENFFQSFRETFLQNTQNEPLALVEGYTGNTQQNVSITDLQTTKYLIIELTAIMVAHT